MAKWVVQVQGTRFLTTVAEYKQARRDRENDPCGNGLELRDTSMNIETDEDIYIYAHTYTYVCMKTQYTHTYIYIPAWFVC